MKNLSCILIVALGFSPYVLAADRQPASATDEMKPVPGPLQLPNATTVLPGMLKFSGFADFRYTAYSAPNNPGVANAHAESGFGIEDGALATSYDQGPVSFTADISIRRLKDSDQNQSATTPNQSSTNRLNFGADGSQLYLKYKANDLWSFDIGQFDGIFGVEAAESRSRSFSKPSLDSGLLPVVFTGAMVEYSSNGWNAKGFASNPSNRGTYGTSASGDENTELGGAVGYSNETFQSQLGYMTRPINTVDGTSRGDRSLIDASFGLSLGKWSLSAEASRIDDPSKNALTPADPADRENAGYGYLALANYKLTDLELIGLRYESLRDNPGATTYTSGTLGLSSAISYGVSFHHRLHANVDLSTEINFYDMRDTNGGTWTDRLFNVGTIISF